MFISQDENQFTTFYLSLTAKNVHRYHSDQAHRHLSPDWEERNKRCDGCNVKAISDVFCTLDEATPGFGWYNGNSRGVSGPTLMQSEVTSPAEVVS